MDFNKIKNALFHILLLYIFYLLQADVFTHLRVFGMCPLLLPMAAVGIGLFEGAVSGGLWGAAAGILCDLACGGSFMFTIFLTLVGYFTGFFGEFVFARGFPSFLTISAAVLILSGILQTFQMFAFRGQASTALAVSILIQTIYSLLFILPAYWSVRAAARPRWRM